MNMFTKKKNYTGRSAVSPGFSNFYVGHPQVFPKLFSETN